MVHFAIFIVNENGSLVYHKVISLFSIIHLLDYQRRIQILNKRYDSSCLHIPLNARHFIIDLS